MTVALDDSIVDVGSHAEEREVAELMLSQGQVSFDDLIEVAPFPEFGLDDSPPSQE